MAKNKENEGISGFRKLIAFMQNTVGTMNNSKIFAGLMIITLNIASKFVSFRLSKSMESYLKYTFSRNVLVFAMAWMGTRDIITAGIITLLFILCMEYLFNEESMFCCLSHDFKSYHIERFENGITDEDYQKARDTVAKYEEQKRKVEESFDDNTPDTECSCNCGKNNKKKVVVSGAQPSTAGMFSSYSS